MKKHLLYLILLIPLSGCGCMPEGGEGVMVKSYFSSCWNEASKGPRNQILFPKP